MDDQSTTTTKTSSRAQHFDEQLMLKIKTLLGNGPLRFGPIKTEIRLDSKVEQKVYQQVLLDCSDEGLDETYTESQILRVVQHCRFNVGLAMSMLHNMHAPYWNTTAQELEHQILSHKLFVPLPNVSARAAQDVFYARPSRCCNTHSLSSSDVVSNLLYVMDSMYERHRDTKRSVGLIVNLKGWKKEAYHKSSHQLSERLINILLGRTAPVRLDVLIMVNRPKWFETMWNSKIKPRLAPEILAKIHIMPDEQGLSALLQPGCEPHLPNELEMGRINLDDLVHDFVAFRLFVEAETRERVTTGTDDWRHQATQRRLQEYRCGGQRTLQQLPSTLSSTSSTNDSVRSQKENSGNIGNENQTMNNDKPLSRKKNRIFSFLPRVKLTIG